MPISALKLAFAAVPMVLASLGHAAPVLVDFGRADRPTAADPSGHVWNNVTSPAAVANPAGATSLLDTDGNATTLRLRITDNFQDTNAPGDAAGGTLTPNPALGYPATATSDFFYGQSSNPTAVILLTGLDPNQDYDFTFFGSRVGATDVRTTTYSVKGLAADPVVVQLDASGNTSNTAKAALVRPTAGGEVTVTVGAAASNTNASKFFYLNVMEINAVPEPGSLALLLAGGVLMVRRGRRN